jgi:uncharacterized protein YkwD
VIRVLPLVALFAIAATAFADDKKEKEPGLTEEEKKIFELTNKAREEEKLPPLKLNALLIKVARSHSANMAKQEKMEHILDDKNPTQRVKDGGYIASRTGENIAKTNGDKPETIFKLWLESPHHKENILREQYEEIGVGIGRNAQGEIYYTQVFATPRKRR